MECRSPATFAAVKLALVGNPNTGKSTVFQRVTGKSVSVGNLAGVTVDTAVAHLAAALNRPTWVLLHRNSDFRWLLDGSDSPWYPGCLRLFRQVDHGDWDSVIKAVHTAVDDLFLLDFAAVKAGRMGHQI